MGHVMQFNRLDKALAMCNEITLRNNTRRKKYGKRRTIYLIECQGFYKIGYAWNLYERLCMFRVHNPTPINLIAKRDVSNYRLFESRVKRRYAHCIQSGEWFKFNDNELSSVINKWFES